MDEFKRNYESKYSNEPHDPEDPRYKNKYLGESFEPTKQTYFQRFYENEDDARDAYKLQEQSGFRGSIRNPSGELMARRYGDNNDVPLGEKKPGPAPTSQPTPDQEVPVRHPNEQNTPARNKRFDKWLSKNPEQAQKMFPGNLKDEESTYRQQSKNFNNYRKQNGWKSLFGLNKPNYNPNQTYENKGR